jgi:glucose uptake protein GlcU
LIQERGNLLAHEELVYRLGEIVVREKLNESHVIAGATAFILICGGLILSSTVRSTLQYFRRRQANHAFDLGELMHAG